MGGLRCGQALVWAENSGEGKGRPPSVYGLASVGGPVLPGGCVGLKPPICVPPPPSLLFPFPTVGLQAAVTSVGFLQPGPQLVQLRHRLPGPLSQSHLPGEELAPHSSSRLPVGQPPPGCSPPPRLRVDSGCPPGKTESEEQTWEVLPFQVHLGTR